MRRPVLALVIGAFVLAGCESNVNPANWGWFSGGSDEPSLAPRGGYEVVSADPRPLVDQVTELRIDRAPGGALITAVGLPPTQGFWAGELVPEGEDVSGNPIVENGEVVYTFRVLPPPGQRRVSTQQSREITVGTFLTDSALAGVRSITVRGQRNQRTSRR